MIRINIIGVDYSIPAPVAIYLSEMADELAQTRAEAKQLRAHIIEADSAFNLHGRVSVWEETSGLVRLCHEGAAALTEVARLREALTEIEKHNPQHNDLDAYLSEVAEWGLGKRPTHPNPVAYGLTP